MQDIDVSDGDQPFVFAFDDAVSVLDRRDILSYVECNHNGRWYYPPLSPDHLAKSMDVAPHHGSCIRLKVNLLARQLEPTRWLSVAELRKFATDFLCQGNGYFERRDNLANRPMRLQTSLARYTRRGVEDGRYYFVQNWKQEHEFRRDSIFHLIQEHPTQEIYGVPEYMGALQSALLNESATLFRRRYYLNGSHAGFILYLNGTDFGQVEMKKLSEQMKQAKGVGNFKNMLLHIPNGKPEGVKIIPIAEAGAKDEFLGIKNVSRDDMLASHRTPPQLLGVVPTNSGGFGDVGKATDVYFTNEIEPLQGRISELNDWLGVEAVVWKPYERIGVAAPPATA
jgi:PBSX family phage portal protein